MRAYGRRKYSRHYYLASSYSKAQESARKAEKSSRRQSARKACRDARLAYNSDG